MTHVDALRALVHRDPDLAAELAAVPDALLEVELLRRADGFGLELTAVELERAMAVARREWTTRWLR